MNDTKQTLGILVSITIMIATLTMLIPAPVGVEDTETYSPNGAVIAIIDSCILLGAAVFFFKALNGFKKNLRTAFRLLAFGAIAGGVLSLFIPFVEYYGLWGNWFYNTLSYLYPVGASIFIYLGLRKFAGAVAPKYRLRSLLLVAVTIAVTTFLYNFLPHIDDWSSVTNELVYDSLQLLITTPLVLYVFSLGLAIKIRKRIGSIYAPAFIAVGISASLQVVAALSTAMLQLTGYEVYYFESRLYMIPFIVADLALLTAGTLFYSIGTARQAPLRAAPQDDEKYSVINILIQAAQLASNPEKVDQYLDAVRVITSRYDVSQLQHLSDEDNEKLVDAYLAIESYLINSEPLKEYDRKSIRSILSSRVKVMDEKGRSFWDSLPA